MSDFATQTGGAGAPPGVVLVTGASGFIGSRLVARLAAAGTAVRAADIAPPRARLEGVDYCVWDVRRPAPDALRPGLSRIYNLAAVHRTPGHPAQDYYETNVLGAAHVTALAERSGARSIVFTSSISVYGPSEAVMTEQSELRPATPYGCSKRLAEAIHRAWLDRGCDRKLVIVRPGVVFGPGERGNYSRLARTLARGLFLYPGRRTTIKSGGHVDELLATLDFALAEPDPLVLYNFAYPEQSTTEDIIAAFAEVCGFKRRHATLPAALLYGAAVLFEALDALGLKNPIHRERVIKLVRSTRIEPGWLKARGYAFQTDLRRALTAWRDETRGTFT